MLLYLKIKPNQRFDAIEHKDDGFIIRVKARAEKNLANIHLVGYLARLLGVPRSDIRVKSGLSSRHKCIEINASEEAVTSRLLAATKSLHN